MHAPVIMGIVNVTPDSFSDGGLVFPRDHPDTAVGHARRLVAAGADVLDVGGESTRPGAEPVDVDEELRRVLPVLERLRDSPAPRSIDTMKSAVAKAAVAAGATIVNDVSGARDPELLDVVAASGAGYVLMHTRGRARDMQYPEERREDLPVEEGGMLKQSYRGVHRLNKDEEGRVKCVACFMCSTACPARCIHIEAEESPWPDREKYPAKFDIDELRCIYCGMCEEACPVDAIELTTLYDLTGLSREEMMFDKEKLLSVFDQTVALGTDPIRTRSGRLSIASEPYTEG